VKKDWIIKDTDPSKLVSSYHHAWLDKLKEIRTYFQENKCFIPFKQVVKFSKDFLQIDQSCQLVLMPTVYTQ
jgi:hypothetical protein